MNSWPEKYFPSNQTQQQQQAMAASGGMFTGNGGGGGGGGFGGDNGQGPNPSFPTSNTPDFLSSLSQMGDSLLATDRPTRSGGGCGGGSSHPRTPMDGQMYNPCTPAADGHLNHPQTPLDGGQLSHPHTPIDGQLCYPRTPIDGGQLCHRRTPMDAQHPSTTVSDSICMTLLSDMGVQGVLRHPSSGPGTPGSLGNPLTPVSGGGANHRCSVGNRTSIMDNNVTNAPACCTSSNAHSNGSTSSSSGSLNSNGFMTSGRQNSVNSVRQQQQDMLDSDPCSDVGFDSDLGFHTPSLIDGEVQTHEAIDVSEQHSVSYNRS